MANDPCSSIQTIVKLEYAPAKSIPLFGYVPGHGAYTDGVSFKELPLADMAKLEVTSEYDGRTRYYKSTLTAMLKKHFDSDGRFYAFRATMASGGSLLVGGPEHPYPSVKTTDTMPDSVTDKSGCSITVELVDTWGLMVVLDR